MYLNNSLRRCSIGGTLIRVIILHSFGTIRIILLYELHVSEIGISFFFKPRIKEFYILQNYMLNLNTRISIIIVTKNEINHYLRQKSSYMNILYPHLIISCISQEINNLNNIRMYYIS